MAGTIWQRLMWWLCRHFGCSGRIREDSPCGSRPEVCTRCNRLISTAYSRAKGAGHD